LFELSLHKWELDFRRLRGMADPNSGAGQQRGWTT
jgi:hypothetical protein